MEGLHSVVLSAPAVAVERLGRWIDKLPIPMHVIGNRRDVALRLGYKAIHKTWSALGCTLPVEHFASRHHYFDCTDFQGVSNKHNIITDPGIDTHVSALHANLLTGSLDLSIGNGPAGFQKLSTNVWTK